MASWNPYFSLLFCSPYPASSVSASLPQRPTVDPLLTKTPSANHHRRRYSPAMATNPEDVTYYSEDNIAGILLIPHGIFSVFATFFVGLRLYTARALTKSRARWSVDEIICMVALVSLLPSSCCKPSLFLPRHSQCRL